MTSSVSLKMSPKSTKSIKRKFAPALLPNSLAVCESLWKIPANGKASTFPSIPFSLSKVGISARLSTYSPSRVLPPCIASEGHFSFPKRKITVEDSIIRLRVTVRVPQHARFSHLSSTSRLKQAIKTEKQK